MNINEINELLKVIDQINLGYIKLETNDLKLEISKDNKSKKEELVNPDVNYYESLKSKEIASTEIYETLNLEDEELISIESPLMGTFYSSPGPDKELFVKVGDIVNVGDTLCIIEAMKLMNEITSDIYGEISEVLVKNEELVEYNQPLFKIKPL